MAGETPITMVGNLTADPRLLRTRGGTPVASFTIASKPRNRDAATNEWKDGEPIFAHCSVFREMATNVIASLKMSDRVIVTGTLSMRVYTDPDGTQRPTLEIAVDDIGVSLKHATATPVRAVRLRRDAE